jgi:hypothetical protein
MKLIIPVLCLAASIYAYQTAPHYQHIQMVGKGQPQDYKNPWRVRFAYLEGSHTKYGWMTRSYTSRDECIKNIPPAVEFLKTSEFKPLGIWCRMDGLDA